MIQGTSTGQRYQVALSNGTQLLLSDATAGKGGAGAGFRPHELLEAALAACINMTVRMYADRHGIPLASVRSSVTLDRRLPEEAAFLCSLEFCGPLSRADRLELEAAARACPVSRTLTRRLRTEVTPARTGSDTSSPSPGRP